MGQNSGISWTDHTFNPWWGCTKVSPGCANCYAETMGGRFGVQWGAAGRRRFFGASHWREPLKWNKAAERDGAPAFVFCASMADVWEDLPDGHPDIAATFDARLRLYELVEATPWLVWLFLSKRPENGGLLVPRAWMTGSWPSNVWAGTTMEDQPRADARSPHLLRLPAPRHFGSYEPALAPVNVSTWLRPALGPHEFKGLDWLIVGGESGPKARPFNVAWARDTVLQCRAAGASPFVKQLGDRPRVDEGSALAGLWAAMPGGRVDDCGGIHLRDPAGRDPAEWLEVLRVQERPAPLPVRGFQGSML